MSNNNYIYVYCIRRLYVNMGICECMCYRYNICMYGCCIVGIWKITEFSQEKCYIIRFVNAQNWCTRTHIPHRHSYKHACSSAKLECKNVCRRYYILPMMIFNRLNIPNTFIMIDIVKIKICQFLVVFTIVVVWRFSSFIQ